MPHRPRGLGLLAVSMIACLGLSACQPTETPPETSPTATTAPASESPTATPTASTEPTPKPADSKGPGRNIPEPEPPKTAKMNSEDGAKDFTDFYFDVVNYALETYDAEPLAEVSSRACYLCGDFLIDPIRRNADRGNWQVGGHYKIEDIVVTEHDSNEYVVSFMVTRDRKRMYSNTGEMVEDSPPIITPIAGAANLKFDSKWIVESLAFEN